MQDIGPPLSLEAAIWVFLETSLLLAEVLLGFEPLRALALLLAARGVGMVIKLLWPRGNPNGLTQDASTATDDDDNPQEMIREAAERWSRRVRDLATRRMTLAREMKAHAWELLENANRHAERRREEADRAEEEQELRLQFQRERQQDDLRQKRELLAIRQNRLKQEEERLDQRRDELRQEREGLHQERQELQQQKQELQQQQHQVQQQHLQQQLVQINLNLAQQLQNPPPNPFHRISRGGGRGSRSNAR